MRRIEADVAVIGGGATGAGVLRDCALRGLRAVLVEKNDLASGTTGRNHGLLHSGARYAVVDRESAVECLAENKILKKTARHCVEDTGGLFVTLPGDDPGYHDRLFRACREAGIEAREVSPAEALRIEPNLNPAVTRALAVPDATIDPFRLAASQVLDAVERGSRCQTHTLVTGLLREGDRLAGLVCRDLRTGEEFEVRAAVTVNAAGVWGQRICALAGVELRMFPSKGSMVIIDYRVGNVVVNRCRRPADGDIIVPGDTVSLIGTTSKEIPYDQIEDLVVDDDEIEVLLADGERLIPNVSKTRVLRAYCGVRPLIALSGQARGRDISRGIVLIDHAPRDSLGGFLTIAGGKLMTSRLMAEKAVDLASAKLGLVTRCRTAEVPLPGSEKGRPARKKIKGFTGLPRSVVGSTLYRHGQRVHRVLGRDPWNYGLVCECEMVTAGEVRYALENLGVTDLIDLRRRTRLGMGPCQGAVCSYRAAGLLNELGTADPETAVRMLKEFLEERWKGVRPVLWGDALREIEFTYWIYQGLFGLGDFWSDPGGEPPES
ncbi:MAG: anaerobic glycerol-3-phosphate dehydrogenase subunit A [Thermodesulfobacteriota bacterium]